MRAKGKTDIGKCRKNNEDFIYVPEEDDVVQNLFIVADGMGGYSAGEVASSLAVESFVKYIKKERKKRSIKETADLLTEATIVSNRVVYEKSISDRSCSEMGTTLVAGTIVQGTLYIVYVGDSRGYLFRDDALIPLTMDHSFVMELVRKGEITREEASVHPNRNVITRAVGINYDVETDMSVAPVTSNDIILLCTDGLTGMLSDEEIAGFLKKPIKIDEKLDELIQAANDCGGKDNISVILVDVGGRN